MAKKIGVFILTHRPTGKYFVCFSSEMEKRPRITRSDLDAGRFSCAPFQAVYTSWDDIELTVHMTRTADEGKQLKKTLLAAAKNDPLCCNLHGVVCTKTLAAPAHCEA